MTGTSDAITRYVAPGGDCGGASPCYATIQAAVDEAGDGDEIRIAEGTYTGVSTEDGKTALVHLRQRDINLTLRGGYTTSDWNQADPAAHPTVLDAQGQGVVIYVACNGCSRRLTFDGLHITGGYTSKAATGIESGAGIHIEDMPHVTVQNCEVYSNTAANDKAGGIRYQDSNYAVIQNNVVRDNTGKGINLAFSRSPDVLDNTVTGNSATGIAVSSCQGRIAVQGNTVRENGRGVWIDSALNGSVENNTIVNNTVGSSQPGGGLMVRWSTLTIRNNVIRGNVSDRGGGLYLEGSSNTLIENNRIESNSATVSWDSEGGGMYLDIGATTTIRGNTVLSNTARGEGGGAYVHGPHPADVLVENNTFTGNSGDLGGGLSINTGTVQGNIFSSNTARLGGGLYTYAWEGLWLKRNLFSGNQADENGGGVYVSLAPPVHLETNRIQGNQAGGNGGGLYSFYQVPSLDGHITLTNTLVAENQATHGSGLYIYGGNATLKHTTLANNGGGDGIGLYVKPFGVVNVSLVNSIIAGQTVGVYAEGGDVSLTGTLWGDDTWDNGDDWAGAGNITSSQDLWDDPLFRDPPNSDYHIQSNSPARDQGIDAGVNEDIDGEVRPNPDTNIPDLGADEYYQPGSIGGMVFEDQNGDGVHDPNEPGIANITITIRGVWGPSTTSTAANGTYLFSDLASGNYTVDVDENDPDLPDGSILTTGNDPLDISLGEGENVLTADFGFHTDTSGTKGDVNEDGLINIVDALLTARHAVNLPVEKFNSYAADVNCDGEINIVDALLIARKAVNLPTPSWCE